MKRLFSPILDFIVALSEQMAQHTMRKSTWLGLGVILTALNLSSCVSHKELVNFGEEPLVPIGQIEQILNQSQLRIQSNDILHITVNTNEDETAKQFNRSGGIGNQVGGGGNNQDLILLSGYLVDSLGNIDFPVLGKIQVGALTLDAAKEKVKEGLLEYLKTPVVNMRFLNFRFTIMGEVGSPGVYTSMNQRVTAIEALGMAGDLTNYADRTEILVVREKNGRREYGTLNLKNKDFFTSPYFYLQQNDMIYIRPLQIKTATVADPVLRWFSYGSAALSLATLIISLSR